MATTPTLEDARNFFARTGQRQPPTGRGTMPAKGATAADAQAFFGGQSTAQAKPVGGAVPSGSGATKADAAKFFQSTAQPQPSLGQRMLEAVPGGKRAEEFVGRQENYWSGVGKAAGRLWDATFGKEVNPQKPEGYDARKASGTHNLTSQDWRYEENQRRYQQWQRDHAQLVSMEVWQQLAAEKPEGYDARKAAHQRTVSDTAWERKVEAFAEDRQRNPLTAPEEPLKYRALQWGERQLLRAKQQAGLRLTPVEEAQLGSAPSSVGTLGKFLQEPDVAKGIEWSNTPLNVVNLTGDDETAFRQDPNLANYKEYLRERERADQRKAKTDARIVQESRAVQEWLGDLATGFTTPQMSAFMAATEGLGAGEKLAADAARTAAEDAFLASDAGRAMASADMAAARKAAEKVGQDAMEKEMASRAAARSGSQSMAQFSAHRALSGLASAGFSAQMLSGVAPALLQAQEDFKKGDVTGGTRSALEALSSVYFGYQSGKHALEQGSQTLGKWRNDKEVRRALETGAQDTFKKPWRELTPEQKSRVVTEQVMKYGSEQAKQYQRQMQALGMAPGFDEVLATLEKASQERFGKGWYALNPDEQAHLALEAENLWPEIDRNTPEGKLKAAQIQQILEGAAGAGLDEAHLAEFRRQREARDAAVANLPQPERSKWASRPPEDLDYEARLAQIQKAQERGDVPAAWGGPEKPAARAAEQVRYDQEGNRLEGPEMPAKPSGYDERKAAYDAFVQQENVGYAREGKRLPEDVRYEERLAQYRAWEDRARNWRTNRNGLGLSTDEYYFLEYGRAPEWAPDWEKEKPAGYDERRAAYDEYLAAEQEKADAARAAGDRAEAARLEEEQTARMAWWKANDARMLAEADARYDAWHAWMARTARLEAKARAGKRLTREEQGHLLRRPAWMEKPWGYDERRRVRLSPEARQREDAAVARLRRLDALAAELFPKIQANATGSKADAAAATLKARRELGQTLNAAETGFLEEYEEGPRTETEGLRDLGTEGAGTEGAGTEGLTEYRQMLDEVAGALFPQLPAAGRADEAYRLLAEKSERGEALAHAEQEYLGLYENQDIVEEVAGIRDQGTEGSAYVRRGPLTPLEKEEAAERELEWAKSNFYAEAQNPDFNGAITERARIDTTLNQSVSEELRKADAAAGAGETASATANWAMDGYRQATAGLELLAGQLYGEPERSEGGLYLPVPGEVTADKVATVYRQLVRKRVDGVALNEAETAFLRAWEDRQRHVERLAQENPAIRRSLDEANAAHAAQAARELVDAVQDMRGMTDAAATLAAKPVEPADTEGLNGRKVVEARGFVEKYRRRYEAARLELGGEPRYRGVSAREAMGAGAYRAEVAPGTFEKIAAVLGHSGQTLEALLGTGYGAELGKEVLGDSAGQYRNPNGTLNDEGKREVRRTLVEQAIGERIDGVPDEVLEFVTPYLAALDRLNRGNPAWRIGAYVVDALRDLADLRLQRPALERIGKALDPAHASDSLLDKYYRPLDYEGGGQVDTTPRAEPNRVTEALAKTLYAGRGDSGTEGLGTGGLTQYADAAEFGGLYDTPVAAFNGEIASKVTARGEPMAVEAVDFAQTEGVTPLERKAEAAEREHPEPTPEELAQQAHPTELPAEAARQDAEQKVAEEVKQGEVTPESFRQMLLTHPALKAYADDLVHFFTQVMPRATGLTLAEFLKRQVKELARPETITTENGTGAKGFYSAATKMLALGDAADASTVVEEVFHAMEPLLKADDAAVLDAWARKRIEVEDKYSFDAQGQPLGGWATDFHEIKAKAFQRYLATGEVPGADPAVKNIFNKLKTALRALYNIIAGPKGDVVPGNSQLNRLPSNVAVKLSPEVRAVFESWFKRDEGGKPKQEATETDPKAPGGAAAPGDNLYDQKTPAVDRDGEHFVSSIDESLWGAGAKMRHYSDGRSRWDDAKDPTGEGGYRSKRSMRLRNLPKGSGLPVGWGDRADRIVARLSAVQSDLFHARDDARGKQLGALIDKINDYTADLDAVEEEARRITSNKPSQERAPEAAQTAPVVAETPTAAEPVPPPLEAAAPVSSEVKPKKSAQQAAREASDAAWHKHDTQSGKLETAKAELNKLDKDFGKTKAGAISPKRMATEATKAQQQEYAEYKEERAEIKKKIAALEEEVRTLAVEAHRKTNLLGKLPVEAPPIVPPPAPVAEAKGSKDAPLHWDGAEVYAQGGDWFSRKPGQAQWTRATKLRAADMEEAFQKGEMQSGAEPPAAAAVEPPVPAVSTLPEKGVEGQPVASPTEVEAQGAEPERQEMAEQQAAIARGNARPMTGIHGKPTGWLLVDYQDGALLIHPTENWYLKFESTNKASGTEALRAKDLAQAYAQDHPVKAAAAAPARDLVPEPLNLVLHPLLSPEKPEKIAIGKGAKAGKEKVAEGEVMKGPRGIDEILDALDEHRKGLMSDDDMRMAAGMEQGDMLLHPEAGAALLHNASTKLVSETLDELEAALKTAKIPEDQKKDIWSKAQERAFVPSGQKRVVEGKWETVPLDTDDLDLGITKKDRDVIAVPGRGAVETWSNSELPDLAITRNPEGGFQAELKNNLGSNNPLYKADSIEGVVEKAVRNKKGQVAPMPAIDNPIKDVELPPGVTVSDLADVTITSDEDAAALAKAAKKTLKGKELSAAIENLAEQTKDPIAARAEFLKIDQPPEETATIGATYGRDQAGQPEDQPEGTAGGAENLPSIPEPPRKSGDASAAVSAQGDQAAESGGDTGADARPADRDGVEHSGGLPQERGDAGGLDGASPAADSAAERTPGGAGEAGRGKRKPAVKTNTDKPVGADGKPVDTPRPEKPKAAKATVAELRNRNNYAISDEYASTIGSGGEISKIKGNLDALELLKKLQAEGREVATPEEQAILAKYVDFGGLVGMLQNRWKPEYKAHYERFERLLTPEEIQEIRETLPNTHYTSLKMVDWMWKAMQKMGLKGGRILEPGMGIGNFFGRIPDDISGKAELYGVERNPLTGAMAKLLYPDARITVKPFQQFMMPDNSLDTVIGNVPFQDFAVTDDPIYKKLKLNLHNYFIVKSLDKLRPGGIAALITSRYTMDNRTGTGIRAREEMAKRADLIAAFRLPDKAFKGNAGTEVVADLLIFRKRAASDIPEGFPDWTKLEKITVPGAEPRIERSYGREYVANEPATRSKEFFVSKYFVDHPENVLGTHSQEGRMHGPGQYTVKAPEDFEAALEEALQRVPAKAFGKVKEATTNQPPTTLDPGELNFAPDDVKPGSYYRDKDGTILIKQGGVGVKLPIGQNSAAARKHIGDAIDLRQQINQLIQTQLSSSDDAAMQEQQKALDKMYEAYRKKYGSLNGPELHKVFGDDPEYPKLLALENVDPETKTISKAAIFTKRVLAPYEPLRELPDDPKSAMLKVIAEKGNLDTGLMAELLKKPEQEVIDNLAKEGLIYQDPRSGEYSTADEYLSGHVREKLRLARQAADTDPRYKANVEALEKVQPKDVSIHEIQPSLGQTWIPHEIYKAFIQHLAGRLHSDYITLSRDESGKWLVQIPSKYVTMDLENKWGTSRVAGHKLVQYAMNQQQPTIYDIEADGKRVVNREATVAAREKLSAIKEEFRTVLRRAPQKVVDQLEEIYNETFGGYRQREFSGEHLTFPGMSEEWRGKIRGYQKASVWRILQEGRGGIFHAPGLGKTLTMAAAGMEARRLKLSRKNMYAVPNHMIPQWRADFKRFYPNSSVLAATDEDFTQLNRNKLMSRIATGDWDAVIVPHSQFDKLPMSPEWEQGTIRKRLEEYRKVLQDLDPDDKKEEKTIKQIEKLMDKLESRLNELNSTARDNTIAFDQMGIDMLFVDEAHLYKSMAVPSKMSGVGGITSNASQRAFSLEMKGDYLRQTHSGRGLVFGTGTPITNTIGELYVMNKYLAPEMLEEAGIRGFDDWVANFAQTVTQYEYAADGVTFKPKTTLSEFVNVPELSTMFRRYAEYLSKDAAKALSNLKEPEVKRNDVMVKITPVQEPLLDMIAARGKALTDHPPRTKEERQADNWLKLSGDARKISLDPRLYDPTLPDHPDSKVNRAVDIIKTTLDATKAKKGTVVVFSDFFQHVDQNGKVDFNLFEDMKKKLVKKGIPAAQIAIIHEAKDKEAKDVIFARVNSGSVRVIFGSTDTMGIGTNIQNLLKAELHLDQPWRPDQVEQREGRLVRSGNQWESVDIHRFIAEPETGKRKVWVRTGFKLVDGKDEEIGHWEEQDRPRAYDLQMYQQLARKASFQEQFLTGGYRGRTMEDVGGDVKLNSQMFALGKAMATGNPDAMRKLKVETDLRTFELLERNYQIERSKNSRSLSQNQYSLASSRKRLATIRSLMATFEANAKYEKDGGWEFPVEIDGRVYDREAQKKLLEKVTIDDLAGKTLKIAGLETEFQLGEESVHNGEEWVRQPLYTYTDVFGEKTAVPKNKAGEQTLSGMLNNFISKAARLQNAEKSLEREIAATEERISDYQKELDKPSPYLERIEAMEKEIAELDQRLGVGTGHAADQDDIVDVEAEEKADKTPATALTAAQRLMQGGRGAKLPDADDDKLYQTAEPARMDSLTPEEEQSTIVAEDGNLQENMPDARVQRFDSVEEAKDWLIGMAGGDKYERAFRGSQVREMPDGKALVVYAPAQPPILYQEMPPEMSMAQLKKLRDDKEFLLNKVPNYRKTNTPEQIARDEAFVAEASRKLNDRPGAIPPPPAPGGGNPSAPKKVESLFPKEAPNAGTDQRRAAPDDNRGVRDAGGVSGVASQSNRPGGDGATGRAGLGGGSDRRDDRGRGVADGRGRPGDGGGVRGASGPGGSGGSRAADELPPLIRMRPPSRRRGAPVIPEAPWKVNIKALGIPSETPPPTVTLKPEVAEVLGKYAGQLEQTEIAASGLEQHDGVIVASGTGGGKTYISLALAKQLWTPESRQLVVTLNRAIIGQRNGWKGVAKRFYRMDLKNLPRQKQMRAEGGAAPGLYATTYAELLKRPDVAKQSWDLVIFDEASTPRRWYERDAKKRSQGMAAKQVSDAAKKAVYVSAAPYHSAVEVGWMTKLGLWEPGQFDEWVKQLGAKRGKNKYRRTPSDPAEAWTKLGSEPKYLIALRDQLIRRGQFATQEISMDGHTHDIALVATSEHQRVQMQSVRQVFTDAEQYYKSRGKDNMARQARALGAIYMKNYLERLKLPQMIELAKAGRARGWDVAMFAENKSGIKTLWKYLEKPNEASKSEQFPQGKIRAMLPELPDVYEELQKALGDVANYSGADSGKRSRMAEDFRSGVKHFLFATYNAGGVGVSFHDDSEGGVRPKLVIHLGLPWSGMMFNQSQGRFWRYGTESNVHSIFLVGDTKPEVDLIMNKVMPRLNSVHAAVRGLDSRDPLVRGMKEATKAEAYKFSLGYKAKYDLADYQHGSAPIPIRDWTDAKAHMPDGEAAKGKGMKYPERPQPKSGATIQGKLFQEETGKSEEETKETPDATPSRFLSVEEAQARLDADEQMEAFAAGEPVPGIGEAAREMEPGDRLAVAGPVAATVKRKIARQPDADPRAVGRRAAEAAFTNVRAAVIAGETALEPEAQKGEPQWKMTGPPPSEGAAEARLTDADRAYERQQMRAAEWEQFRNAENAKRAAAGQPPLKESELPKRPNQLPKPEGYDERKQGEGTEGLGGKGSGSGADGGAAKSRAFRFFDFLFSGMENIKALTADAGVAEVGREVERVNGNYRAGKNVYQGNFWQEWLDIRKEHQISDRDMATVVAVKEGRQTSSDPRILRTVEALTRQLNRIWQMAGERGIELSDWDEATGEKLKIPIARLLNNPTYFPHIFDYEKKIELTDRRTGEKHVFTLKELLGGKTLSEIKRDRIVSAIAAENGLDRATVEEWLDAKRTRKPLAGNLERVRKLDLPFYRVDEGALLKYYGSVGEVFARTEHFGQDLEKLEALYQQIPDVRARKDVKNIMDGALAPPPWSEKATRLYSLVTTGAIITKMTFSPVKLPFHLVHTGLVLEQFRPLLKSMFQLATGYSDMRRFATVSGALADGMQAQVNMEFAGKQKLTHGMLKYTGFNWLYAFDRMLAAQTARNWMGDYALPELVKKGKGAARVREQLRENMLLTDAQIDAAVARGRWGENDFQHGAATFTNKVMFTSDATEMPYVARMRFPDHPKADDFAIAVRAMFTMKSFMFKTATLLKRSIYDEAKKGNFKPMVLFFLAYPAAGAALRWTGAGVRAAVGQPAALKKQETDWNEIFSDPSIAKLAHEWVDDVGGATALTIFSHILDVLFFPPKDKRKKKYQREQLPWDVEKEAIGPYADVQEALKALAKMAAAGQDALSSDDADRFEELWQQEGKAGLGLLGETLPAARPAVPWLEQKLGIVKPKYEMAPPP